MAHGGSENPDAYLNQSQDSSTLDDIAEAEFTRQQRCCFCTPSRLFFNSSDPAAAASSSYSTPPGCWERVSGRGCGNDGFVVVRAWKKMREWSEIVAGPKWKNFIRRMGRSVKGNRQIGTLGCQQQQRKFGYDPLSYAMNFDEGRINGPSEEIDNGLRNFSSRYASFPSSAKSSMDLGKDGSPSFL